MTAAFLLRTQAASAAESNRSRLISYLGDDKWASKYDISLDLFNSAAEAACVLNENAEVASYTKELVANAKSFDDSLNCEY